MTVQEIYGLIKTNQVHQFYNDGAWKQLAATIRKEQHNECQRCKANGKYHYAVLVHHVNHLREHPELAYSKTYIDSNGQEQRNLILLCSQCGNGSSSTRIRADSEFFNRASLNICFGLIILLYFYCGDAFL